VRSLVQYCCVLFRDLYHARLGWVVPGDVASAITNETQMADMYLQEPALRCINLQGKYAPWSTATYTSWASHERKPAGKNRMHSKTVDTRALAIWEILTLAVQTINLEPMAVWNRNCGRKVSHHSGYLALLLRLKIVQPMPEQVLPNMVSGWPEIAAIQCH
jgi:hypothetical protein